MVTTLYPDDAGTIFPLWDNGRTLGLVPEADSFRKLTQRELREEMRDRIVSSVDITRAISTDESVEY